MCANRLPAGRSKLAKPGCIADAVISGGVDDHVVVHAIDNAVYHPDSGLLMDYSSGKVKLLLMVTANVTGYDAKCGIAD